MSPRLISSIILRDIIEEIEQVGKGRHLGEMITPLERITLDDEDWAETVAKKYHRALQEHPVVVLTEEENSQAREYLARYKEVGLDIPERATQSIRGNHAIEIRNFLKAMHYDEPQYSLWESSGGIWDVWDFLPHDNQDPACFKEWFAVIQVWRLTLAKAEIPFKDAAIGTSACVLGSLPKLWEDKLDECMQITSASAIIPTPRGRGLPVTRHDLNSVLPTLNISPDSPGLVTDTIIDRWFQILTSRRDQRKRGSTVFIHPDSLELAAATPQEVAENMLLVDADIEMILFPTVIKEQDHCILFVALPQSHVIVVYDSLGPESTKRLQKNLSWIKETGLKPETRFWEVTWMKSPKQGQADACGVFMLINAMLIAEGRDPDGGYSQEDAMFLRRYIAAVICMGELPEKRVPLSAGYGNE